MHIYLSGPMTGYLDENFAAFNAAAEELRAAGYSVFNPADLGHTSPAMTRAKFMRLDIAAVLDADAVAVLPGWQNSRGATLEVEIGQQLGLPILDAATLEPVHETICQEADRLVHGARNADYGHPIEDFSRTGRMWAAILGIDEVTPEQVGLCMIAVKISRYVNKPKRDSLTDCAGYAATLEMIADEQARRAKG